MPGVSDARGVLDASVAVRWLVDEVGSEDARAIVEAASGWLAPHLLVAESASALRRKVGVGILSASDASMAVEVLKRSIADEFITLVGDHDLVSTALNLALSEDHKLPDCLYLALAERDGLMLATADIALSRIAKRRGNAVAFVNSPPP